MQKCLLEQQPSWHDHHIRWCVCLPHSKPTNSSVFIQNKQKRRERIMSSIGTGYDLSCTTFSPDGRVFQVEYANKAVDNSGTVVGIQCKDGVVLVVEKLVHSKMLVEGSNRRVHTVDDHAGAAAAGLAADARQVVRRAREEAQSWRALYGSPVPVRTLCARVGAFVQAHTLYAHLRPFGCALLFAGADADAAGGARLFCVEPSGLVRGHRAAAIGKGRQTARTELEKLRFGELSARDALYEAARAVLLAHDETKDKLFELEMSWVCEATAWRHEVVPRDVRDAVQQAAQAAVDQAMQDA